MTGIFGAIPAGGSPALLLYAAVAVFGSAVIRGFTGFGFAIAAVPLLSLVLQPVDLVPAVLVLNMAAGAQQVHKLWSAADWLSVRWLLLGSLAGLPLGIALLTRLPADLMRFAIAAVVLFAVLALWGGFRFHTMPGRVTSLAVGALSGLLNGAAAMPGPPVILLYLSGPTAVAVGRASLVMFFFFSAAIGTALAVAEGLITGPTLMLTALMLTALMLPALVLGNRLGDRGFDRSSPQAYRRVAFGSLLAIALIALVRSLAGILG
jgi:uncharacterized membrane protein YfcA